MGERKKVLRVEKINPAIRNADYAVRGELAIKADYYKQQLLLGKKLPFDEIVYCNIGNPQQLGQKPITFFRQVSALLEVPDLIDNEDIRKLFPSDAIARAKKLKENIGSIGAYSHSQGILHVRQNVAKFIEERDGFPCDPNDIFLTGGASEGVKSCLNILMEHSKVGVLIPIPQYPLYSASMTLFNGVGVPYPLNEDDEWSLSITDLKKSVEEARSKGIDVRALVVINPGNPTGQCLKEDNMREIVRFCYDQRLLLLADEVYQTNVYDPNRKFHSFKKVAASVKLDGFELVSFHSVSKGMVGECGRRGGYFECYGIDNHVKEQLYKMASISLCPSIQGQVMVDLMVNPPKEGEPSYPLYYKETLEIFQSLKRRSEKLTKAFNEMEGVTCNKAQGAMYTFPHIRLPAGAIQAAKQAGKQADTFYCLALLDETGVCVVPGSGFGQKENTFHFRATFLPPESKFDDFVKRIQLFHSNFIKKYQTTSKL